MGGDVCKFSKKEAREVKRLLALRVCSAFRRTSDDAGGAGHDPSRHLSERNECASSCRTYVGAHKTQECGKDTGNANGTTLPRVVGRIGSFQTLEFGLGTNTGRPTTALASCSLDMVVTIGSIFIALAWMIR